MNAAPLLPLLLGALSLSSATASSASLEKPRLFVLTDIGADPDDTQSLVRLLTYSNEIDIEGMSATTSLPQRTRVHPELIHEVLEAYGKVRANLSLHDSRYPTKSALAQLVTVGAAKYGMSGVGAQQESSASRALVRALQKQDGRPLWVTAWGGPNVLAQALWTIRATMSADEAARLRAKLRVYTISDQDDSGPWIRKEFPDVFYIVTPGSWGRATWMAMGRVIEGADNESISAAWLRQNIQQGHGALGAVYPDVAYGMEGDTPSWLGLIPNGLSNMEHPDWGGWGGRYELYLPQLAPPDPHMPPGAELRDPETRPIWTNAQDAYPPPIPPSPFAAKQQETSAPANDNFVTLWRWRGAVQNDFAARTDWTTKPYNAANHPPIARIAGSETLTVRSGQAFDLDASPSRDPDGDSLSFRWYQYPEAGTYKKVVSFQGNASNLRIVHDIVAPPVDKAETVHFILEVTDKGSPALTRYRRVVVNFIP